MWLDELGLGEMGQNPMDHSSLEIRRLEAASCWPTRRKVRRIRVDAATLQQGSADGTDSNPCSVSTKHTLQHSSTTAAAADEEAGADDAGRIDGPAI